jgi:acyl-CoA thioesterase I
MGRLCTVVCVIALTCLTTGCAASSPKSEASSSSIVALGDSVPRGTNCRCTPYPPLTAEDLTASTGKTVTATNDAVGGYTTSDVLHQLESDGAVIDHVRAARTVELEVGANDVAYSKSCGVTVDCYAPDVPGIEKNLAAIVRRVHDLASGHKVLIVLLDYWSVWLGGQYAAAKGDAYVAAAEEMTDRVNTVIKSTAAMDGSAYVDLRAAFKGPDYAYDETHFLSNDGDHPNAAGHQQIAKATAAVIEKSLHL